MAFLSSPLMHKNEYRPPDRSRKQRFLTEDDVKKGKKSKWTELEITGPVRALSPALWNLHHLTALYLNDNYLQRLPAEVSLLTNLLHLDLSSNKLRSLPSELGNMLHLRELLLNHNQLRVLPYELGRLFQLQKLGLDSNPLQPEIYEIWCQPNGTSELIRHLLDNMPHPMEQPQRQWISLEEPSNPTSCLFSVMCYNVLSDKYCTRQMYGYSPSWCLRWEHRQRLIFEEMFTYDADVLCLQEVETCEFNNTFLPELRKHGYMGVFSPKSRAKTMIESESQNVDGCAIFWKTEKFLLLENHTFEFNQLAIKNSGGDQDILNRVMTKDNVAVAVVLKTLKGLEYPEEETQEIVVCNTHMHWDPEFSDVKMIQTFLLTTELDRVIRQMGRKPTDVPVILCGDYNSLPTSGVTEFVKEGKVELSHPEFQRFNYNKKLVKMNPKNGEVRPHNDPFLRHPFNFKASYLPELMPFTNYTYDFKGIIDYIYHSSPHLKTIGILGGLDDSYRRSVVGFPNPVIPSDHLCLLSEFELLPSSVR